MKFKGQLLIPAEGGPGLPVDLQVEGRELSVSTESETLGVWPLDSVRVRRLAGDMFAMKVAGEDLHFVADDTISFAYDGISAIERRNPPLRGRKAVLKGLKGLLGREDAASLPTGTTSEGTATDSAMSDSRSVLPVDDTVDLTEQFSTWFSERPSPDDAFESLNETMMTVHRGLPESEGVEGEPNESPSGVESQRHLAGDKAATCRALRNDGFPCESPIIGDSGFCYPHDPANPVGKTFKDAQEARARLRDKRALRLSRVYSRLDKALSQVERGEMDNEQAMAMAQLARTMCAILELDDEAYGEEAPTSPSSF